MSNLAVVGGEFLFDPSVLNKNKINNMFPKYSLGRTCLYSILESNKLDIEELLCPDYICYSVVEVPHRLNISIKHYNILDNFMPEYESIRRGIGINSKKKAILLIAYFGMTDLDEVVLLLRNEYPSLLIIIDDVQNFFGFGRHIDYDYCFSSYRKWFCSPDGADILQGNNRVILNEYMTEPNYTKYKIAGNLLKNYRVLIDDNIALELISKGENLMDKDYLFRCSSVSVKVLNRTELSDVEKKRRKNATYLHKRLNNLGITHLYNPDSTPLFLPIYVENRDEIRKHLFNMKIFVPIHWSVVDTDLQGNNELYMKELSLICDQRYDEEDMERMLKGIEDVL